jgi:hypothetical protein
MYIHIGTERKRVRFEDEEEFMDRRRSSRIVASKEKKQQEKERKLTLLLERNKNSTKKKCNKSQLISLFKVFYFHINRSVMFVLISEHFIQVQCFVFVLFLNHFLLNF